MPDHTPSSNAVSERPIVGEDKSPTRALTLVIMTLAPLTEDDRDRVLKSARAFFGLDE